MNVRVRVQPGREACGGRWLPSAGLQLGSPAGCRWPGPPSWGLRGRPANRQQQQQVEHINICSSICFCKHLPERGGKGSGQSHPEWFRSGSNTGASHWWGNDKTPHSCQHRIQRERLGFASGHCLSPHMHSSEPDLMVTSPCFCLPEFRRSRLFTGCHHLVCNYIFFFEKGLWSWGLSILQDASTLKKNSNPPRRCATLTGQTDWSWGLIWVLTALMHFLGHLSKLDGKVSRWPTLPRFLLLLMPTHTVAPPLKIHRKWLLIYIRGLRCHPLPILWSWGTSAPLILMVRFPFGREEPASRSALLTLCQRRT